MALIFFSYSHVDETLRDRLEVHLAMLRRQGLITAWHDRRLMGGDDIDKGIDTNLEKADLILLLVSPDFLASTYCYDNEMQRAMERHAAGEARVLPVILRPSDWHDAPFGKLKATPKDGKPITKYADLDEAFLEVAHDIKSVVSRQVLKPNTSTESKSSQFISSAKPLQGTRSSNLRIRKEFTEADKDRFLDDAFSFMCNFFENSLAELAQRNNGVEITFKRIDTTQFTAVVYMHGKAQCRCRIFHGGMHSMISGIAYSSSDSVTGGSFNECLTVEKDEQGLFLKAMMDFRGRASSHMTFEGASEFYWSTFIEPLQR